MRENLHFNRCFWLAVYKPWNSYPGSAGGDPLAWNRWLNTRHLPEGSESLSQPGSQAHSALLGPRVHWALPSGKQRKTLVCYHFNNLGPGTWIYQCPVCETLYQCRWEFCPPAAERNRSCVIDKSTDPHLKKKLSYALQIITFKWTTIPLLRRSSLIPMRWGWLQSLPSSFRACVSS